MRSILVVCVVAVVPALMASCGGEFKAASGDAGGSGGASGSSAGGVGGKGGTGGKSGTGGSSGSSGVGGTAGIGGKGGTGGTGGTGGVVDKECATDADCVLGYRVGLCCGDCFRAMSRAFVDTEPCYCARNETCDATSSCQEDPCPDACPAIGCPAVTGVTCAAGACTELYSSTGGTSGTGGTGGTGGSGGICQDQIAEYDAVVIEARKCNPGLTGQCSGQTTVPDRCGCPIVLNDMSAASADAQYFYEQWISFGCGPLACGVPCIQSTSGVCQADVTGGHFCQWAP